MQDTAINHQWISQIARYAPKANRRKGCTPWGPTRCKDAQAGKRVSTPWGSTRCKDAQAVSSSEVVGSDDADHVFTYLPPSFPPVSAVLALVVLLVICQPVSNCLALTVLVQQKEAKATLMVLLQQLQRSSSAWVMHKQSPPVRLLVLLMQTTYLPSCQLAFRQCPLVLALLVLLMICQPDTLVSH